MARLIKYSLIPLSLLLLLTGCDKKEEEDLMDLEKMAVSEGEESVVLPMDDQPFIVDSTLESQELLVEEKPGVLR